MAPVPNVESGGFYSRDPRALLGLAAIGRDEPFPEQKTRDVRQWEELPSPLCRASQPRIFRTTKRGSGMLEHPEPRLGTRCPALLGQPPRRPAAPRLVAGRGRPLAAKRRGGPPEASVHSAAAGARAERLARGQGAAGTAQSAHTHTDGGDPTAAPPRSPTPAQRPSASRPAQLAAYPGLPMAPEAGAAPRARCPLPWAALLLLAALLPVVSPAGAPGMRSPGLAARLSAPPRRLSVHPPCTTTHPACRSGDRRPLCAVRVVSLTCASSSLAGRGAEGAAADSGSGHLALRAREADVGTPLVPGTSVPWFQLCRRTPRSPETRAVSLTSPRESGK